MKTMRVSDYVAVMLTIVLLIGLAGCFVMWGSMQFWFAAGVAVLSAASLCIMADEPTWLSPKALGDPADKAADQCADQRPNRH